MTDPFDSNRIKMAVRIQTGAIEVKRMPAPRRSIERFSNRLERKKMRSSSAKIGYYDCRRIRFSSRRRQGTAADVVKIRLSSSQIIRYWASVLAVGSVSIHNTTTVP
jgi:hypothetical protein